MKFTRDKIYETAKKLSNWGRWGDNDQIGTLNNIEPADIVAAAQLIKKGQVFSLGLSLKEPIQSGLFGGRWVADHVAGFRWRRVRRSGPHGWTDAE